MNIFETINPPKNAETIVDYYCLKHTDTTNFTEAEKEKYHKDLIRAKKKAIEENKEFIEEGTKIFAKNVPLGSDNEKVNELWEKQSNLYQEIIKLKEQLKKYEQPKQTKLSIPITKNTIGRTSQQETLFDALLNYPEWKEHFSIIGADLTLPEHNTINALQGLITEQNLNKDNELIITRAEFLRAYGVEQKRNKKGKLKNSSYAESEAIGALKNLSGKQFILEKESTNGTKKTELYYKGNFYNIGICRETENGETKKHLFYIELNKMFFSSYFQMVPANLNSLIKQAYPRSKHFTIFISMLICYHKDSYKRIKENNWQYKASYRVIAERTKLSNLIETRQKKRLETQIIKFCDKAKEMNLLEAFEVTTTTRGEKAILFTYNPAFFQVPQTAITAKDPG